MTTAAVNVGRTDLRRSGFGVAAALFFANGDAPHGMTKQFGQPRSRSMSRRSFFVGRPAPRSRTNSGGRYSSGS
jgi:hypothetical protein